MIEAIEMMHRRTHTPILIPIIVIFESDGKLINIYFRVAKKFDRYKINWGEYRSILKQKFIPAAATVISCTIDVLLSDISSDIELAS